MWEYISATYPPVTTRQLHIVYPISALVDIYNKIHGTTFRGFDDGWIKQPDLGQCHIKTLDGMCGVMIAHKMTIDSINIPHWAPLLQYMAEKGNYTYITLSNVVGPRLAAWKEQGWTTMLSFRNKRTGNNVELLIKKVEYAT